MDFLATFPATVLGYGTYIAALLVALTLIVFIHEYGHFKIGRLCGMKIDTFSIGFGREIWGKTDRYGTRWKIGWLPVGGYVRFAGDLNAASQPDVNIQPKPDEFHGKPIWQRALVVLAGPVANFILAFFLFAAFFLMSGQTLGTRIGEIIPGSAAEQGGLKPNDVVIKINGREVKAFDGIVEIVRESAGKSLIFDVDRSGEKLALTLVPVTEILDGGFYGKHPIGRIGAAPSRDPSNLMDVTLGRSAQMSADEISRIVTQTVKYVGRLVTGNDSLAQLGGVGTMAKLSGDAASSGGFFPYVYIVALLSVSIGLINLFPIPMLDGGHLVFYAIEAIRRKPLGPQAQEWSFRIGFAVVIFIMLVGNMNDLMRAVVGNLPY